MHLLLQHQAGPYHKTFTAVIKSIAGIVEIEKGTISKSLYQKNNFLSSIEESHHFGQNFSVQDEKVLDEQTDTIGDIFQQSVFEMSCLDIVKAKNFTWAFFNTKNLV